MPTQKKTFKNILIIRTDRIGDFLLNIPLILNLKSKFPDCKITALVSEHIADLKENLPFIDGFIIYNNKCLSFFGKLKLMDLLAKRKFDLAIISNPNKFFNWITYFSGIPVRIGYDRKLGFLLSHKIKDKKHQNLKHEIEYNLDLLKAIGISPKIISPYMFIKNDDRRKIDALFKSMGIDKEKPVIAVQSQSSNSTKCWPEDNFAKVCDNLISDLDMQIVFIGNLEERQSIEKILNLMRSKAYNLAGQLKLNELAALLKKVSLLISNDSGPMHIASFVQTPIIAIFGKNTKAASPVRWGPWGKNHIIIHDAFESITPEEVSRLAKEGLEKYNYA